MYKVTGNARARKNKRFKLLQVSVLRFHGGFESMDADFQQEKPKIWLSCKPCSVTKGKERSSSRLRNEQQHVDAGNVETEQSLF